jgi:hypothetical protein
MGEDEDIPDPQWLLTLAGLVARQPRRALVAQVARLKRGQQIAAVI